MITQSTVLPLVERQARTRARWLRTFRFVLAAAAVLAPITLALALWLATRNELGSAVTLLCLDVPLWVAAYVRLTDVGPKTGERS